MVIIYLFSRPLYHSNFKIKGNSDVKYDKLMIVAHPDDELIFGGAELLSKKGWKVVTVTNCTQHSANFLTPFSPDRRKEFVTIMNKLGHNYEIWDYEDNRLNCNWNTQKLEHDIRNLLKQNKLKMIVTHNLKGEYGHKQHKKLSEIMHKIVKKNLYVFGTTDKINPHAKKVTNILKMYPSQQGAIKDHKKYTLYQSIVRVN